MHGGRFGSASSAGSAHLGEGGRSEKRLETALTELYDYYDRVGDALAVIIRDLSLVPELAALNAPYLATWESMREVPERAGTGAAAVAVPSARRSRSPSS